MPEFEKKLAHTLVTYSLSLQPGDLLLVRTTQLAAPLLPYIYQESLKAGANVVFRLTFEGQEDILLDYASDDQLAWVNPADLEDIRHASARLTIDAPFFSNRMTAVESRRIGIHNRALHCIGKTASTRASTGELRTTLTVYPTEALAFQSGMPLSDFRELIRQAMFLDHDDPISHWRSLSKIQQAQVEYLNTVRSIHIETAGTDITFATKGRKWINSDGKRNFPSGEVFTGPVEESVNGRISFPWISYRQSRSIVGAWLEFRDGKVEQFGADEGEEVMAAELSTDEGAKYLGELAIGNNAQITKPTHNTLLDEKIAGSFHVALGNAYPETGGLNKSAIHWDLVADLRNGGEITADGEVIHRNGVWLI